MNNLKPISVFIITSFLSGFAILKFTQQFRFIDEFRWIYQTGGILCFSFELLSLVLSFIVLILFLKRDINLKTKYKFIWIIFSLIPLLFWVFVYIQFGTNI